jgi:hypothetical protein
MTDRIDQFSGKYRFLSNFYPGAGPGQSAYATVEHRFQATKAADEKEAAWVRTAPTAAEAKRRGRRVRMRADWDQVKIGVMLICIRDKFKDPALRRLLLATEDTHLEEGNTWGDTFWGTVNGRGQNHLGRILMQVRSEIRGDDW